MRGLWLARVTLGLPLLAAPAAAQDPDAGCAAAFEQQVDECTDLFMRSAALDAAEARAFEAEERVRQLQRGLDAAAPADQGALRPELDTARREHFERQAAAAAARAARSAYESRACEAFALGEASSADGHRFTKTRPAEPACTTLGSLVGVIRAMRGFESLPARPATASEAVRQRIDAAGIGATTPETATSVNKSGTSAQIEPVESARPIALAGGAISFAGTESGGQTVATISMNPLALATPNDQRAQRALDVSVTAPIDMSGGDGKKLRFLGVRLRSNGSALTGYQPLEAAANEYAQASGAFADAVELALRHAPDVSSCFAGLVAQGKATRDACGNDLDDLVVVELRETFYRELQQARRQADQYYWGLDLRLDVGDAGSTNSSTENDIHLLAGLVGGGRIPLGEWDLEYRGRAAGDYFDANDDGPLGGAIEPVFSADWGAGMILGGRPTTDIAKQRVGFGLGLEGRHSLQEDPSALAPTNYVDLRLMVVVPTTNGNDLGIGIRIPLQDSDVERGTAITVSGDFGLLSPEGKAAL